MYGLILSWELISVVFIFIAVEKKKCSPIIAVFPEVAHFTKSGSPLTVDFELSGHPEPVLNVFRGNDIITSLGTHLSCSNNATLC